MKRYFKAFGKACIATGTGAIAVLLLDKLISLTSPAFFATGFIIAVLAGLTWVFTNE